MSKFSHLDDKGKARMVDVGGKQDTKRTATARGRVTMQADTLKLLVGQALPKGDVLTTARLAGIMGAKKTPELIPLCHPLDLSNISVDFEIIEKENAVEITAKASLTGKTGVEMEALTAVSVAALTLYDMVKGVDKDCIISDIRLIEKTGGKSGAYKRK